MANVSFHEISRAIFDAKMSSTGAGLVVGGLYFITESDGSVSIVKATGSKTVVDLTGSLVSIVGIEGSKLMYKDRNGTMTPSDAVVGATLGSTLTSASGAVAATDSILTALSKLNSKIASVESAQTSMFRYKGTIGSSGATVTALPTSGVKVGDAYRVITAGTYASQTCEVGDMIIATATTPTWTVVQTNVDMTAYQPKITSSNKLSSSLVSGLGTAAAKDVPASGNASNSQVVLGSDTRLSNSRPASDVYAWAKAASKPSYGVSEITGLQTALNGKLSLTGGELSGALVVNGDLTAASDLIAASIQTGGDSSAMIGTNSNPFDAAYINTVHGNAATASKLAVARSIGLTGDVTGSGSFDGSEALSFAATLANSGVTAGSYGETTTTAATLAHSGSFKVPILTVDAKGRVTSAGTKTITLPASGNTDTKNTAGSTNSTNKLFLVGATSQASSAVTYSHSSVYATGGKLYSNAKEVVNLSDTQALTNKTYNGFTLAAACAKGVTTAVTANNDNLVTSGGVSSALNSALNSALQWNTYTA